MRTPFIAVPFAFAVGLSASFFALGCERATDSNAEVSSTGPVVIPANARTVRLNVEGMSCVNCENAIKAELAGLGGVYQCDVSAETGIAVVSVDPDNADASDATIIASIEGLGFSVPSIDEQAEAAPEPSPESESGSNPSD